jgi:hypothetical protein
MKCINIFQSKGPQKFTQIGILGLKRNHLATLVYSQSEMVQPTSRFKSDH